MNEKKPERSIRLSQGITTYGVGAIVGIGEESFINKDIFQWIGNDDMKITIKFPRLAQRLNVQEFKHPKPKQYRKWGGKFRFSRFPRWLFCPICRSMKEITFQMDQELDGRIPKCSNPSCSGHGRKELLPIRFVTVCENGHISDFPWWRWAHSKVDRSTHGNCQTYDRLEFITAAGSGASWDALVVRCRSCGAKRSLGGLENKDALKEIGHQCTGRQPWQRKESAVACDETPQMVQRNASNIYQPNIVSAIDIPQATLGGEMTDGGGLEEMIRSHKDFATCKRFFDSSPSRDNAPVKMIVTQIASDCDCSENDIFLVLEGNMVKVEEDTPSRTTYQLKNLLQFEEWKVFFLDIEEKKFVNIKEVLCGMNEIEEELISYFDHTSLVKRLKEVRAFNGFNRVKFDPGKRITPSVGRSTTWLPAIEVYGEGIFLSFDKERLDRWYTDNRKEIDERLSTVRRSYEKKEMEEQFGPFSAKFLLLHTFSHLLIRQLAFESGYSSSSLRENIYFSEDGTSPMAGVLIYTADSDSEGSLGGLVRQGESERLLPTIIIALQRALWCSADPVCRESNGQGQDGMNKAACHACSLISETSCTHFNTLLDRTLLIDDKMGFFKDLYQMIKDRG